MNIKKRRIHNFANLSIFMNNIAYSFILKIANKVSLFASINEKSA